MPAKGHISGNKIIFYKEKWRYEDNGEEILNDRPCVRCGRMPDKYGHDSCLGNLPGVKNACCGHGDISRAYVQLEDGKIYDGERAIKILKSLKEAI